MFPLLSYLCILVLALCILSIPTHHPSSNHGLRTQSIRAERRIQLVSADDVAKALRLERMRRRLGKAEGMSDSRKKRKQMTFLERTGMNESMYEIMKGVWDRIEKENADPVRTNKLNLTRAQLEMHTTEKEIEWLMSPYIPKVVWKPGVDMIYVVNLDMCTYRAEAMKIWAYSLGVEIQRWSGKSFSAISFDNPPIPIINLPVGDSVTKGQVGCTTTHIQIWRDAWANQYRRILVLEDDVTLTRELTIKLAPELQQLDDLAKQVAMASNGTMPPYYHFLYLRRYALHSVMDEKVYGKLSNGKTITHAVPSWGTAAYVLTLPGMEWLLSHLTYYMFPLDVQLSKFQQYRPDFIALCFCNKWMEFRNQCPENTYSFAEDMRGDCTYSASQAGGHKSMFNLPNAWRYHEEHFNESIFYENR